MSSTITPLKSAYSRVFLVEGGVAPDNQPVYHNELRATGLSYGFGDLESIEVPDPAKLGSFIEVGEIRGSVERPSTQLQGRYPAKGRSDLFRIAKVGCYADIHIVIGACNDPRAYDEYDKIIVFEEARITNYETDDLGALAFGDNSAVNETGDVSGKSAYEVVPVSVGLKGGSVVTLEVLDVVVCDSVSCGDCEESSDGCKKIFATTVAAGGSPTTPPDIVYSKDGGITWVAHDIESLGAAEGASGIACLGSYIVVVSADSDSLHYALKSEMDNITDPSWTEVATGFVAGRGPLSIWSLGDKAFAVGEGGYIYRIDSPVDGATVIDAGALTSATLRKIHGIDDENMIAVGDNGAVLYTTNGTEWAMSPASPVGYGTDLLCCWMKTLTEWWVGSEAGNLYYTKDAGITWTAKTFAGSGAGIVYDIKFSTKSVGWMSHSTATPRARMFRTTNGGATWKLIPEATGVFPASQRINSIAVCEQDPNFAVGVGLSLTTDGVIALAAAA